MRKKSPTSPVPVHPTHAHAILGSGPVTPEMQDILTGIDTYDPVTQAATEQYLRDAVGKLFIAALQQVYEQQQTILRKENEE
ncbi:hypothetical protein F0L74_32610 [Chitinophaga agrisoli]|uniref:Uncharacterized protein n=1 Tax=Chitinophaga agrisoli TaxID=2607653 RepID=A0A5B2VQ73_9BACT|nr:hypothetical protein [Chitinophaga agrisoli]KAA2240874.1 hypothetical protein F0L74_32610 [Chitinophaga agrisoli]